MCADAKDPYIQRGRKLVEFQIFCQTYFERKFL